MYVDGIVQYGCCGACMRYRGENEKCSGSVDPQYQVLFVNFDASETTRTKTAMTSLVRETKSTIDDAEKNVIQSSLCDYNLKCNSSNVCVADASIPSCQNVQSAYDKDIVNGDYVHYRDEYRWRPDCDEKGYYKPKQCKGSIEEEQTCVCSDKYGETISGKAFPWQTELYDSMNCLCSRLYNELTEAELDTSTLHCRENGNFEVLQCELDWCLCVNETTGMPVSEVLPEASIQLLPCYNSTTQGSIYLRKCDSEYHARQVLNKALRGHGVYQVPTSLLTCDQDGAYGERQCLGSDCYCVDKYESYLAAPSSIGTDCHCARDQYTYEQAGQPYEFKCDTTNPGEYFETQQTGALVYCVDSEGIRTSTKVREQCLDSLSCENAVSCQAGDISKCESVCTNCPPEAYYFNDDYKESDEC